MPKVEELADKPKHLKPKRRTVISEAAASKEMGYAVKEMEAEKPATTAEPDTGTDEVGVIVFTRSEDGILAYNHRGGGDKSETMLINWELPKIRSRSRKFMKRLE